VTAGETKPQVNPGVAHLETFLATLGFGLYRADLIEVRADIGHYFLLEILLGGLDGDANLKTRVARDGRDTNVAADILDDAADYIQAQTRAFANSFGREKRIKNAGKYVGRNSRAVVANFHKYEIVFTSRADGEFAAIFHGVGGVVDEICPNLIKFAAAGHDLREGGSVLSNDRDAAL